ncbi:MAG: hypothetical protein FJZ01_01825 [Candidatus Sericytochromatia bacterium]|nr:hypothetical protein [Candidatus Tanganyikabacteria bacterium]
MVTRIVGCFLAFRPAISRAAAILLTALALLAALAGTALAEGGKPPAGAPVKAKVAFELLGIRNVNPLAGQFEADFNLSFKCSGPCEPAEFLLENGRISSAVPVVKEPANKVYLVRAQLIFDVETQRIPFDRQRLLIQLRTEDPAIEYEFDPNETPVDLKLSVVDWVPGKKLDAAPTTTTLGAGDGSAFRYTFGVTVERSVLWSVLRFMLPALALVFSGFLVLVLPSDFKAQLGMALASFIGQIFLQLSLGGRVPVRDTTLPYWDQYLVISYAAIGAVIVYLFVDNALKEKELEEIRKKVTYWVKALVPSTWLALQLLVAITTLW